MLNNPAIIIFRIKSPFSNSMLFIEGIKLSVFNVVIIRNFSFVFTFNSQLLIERPGIQRPSTFTATDFARADLLEYVLPSRRLPQHLRQPFANGVEEGPQALEDTLHFGGNLEPTALPGFVVIGDGFFEFQGQIGGGVSAVDIMLVHPTFGVGSALKDPPFGLVEEAIVAQVVNGLMSSDP